MLAALIDVPLLILIARRVRSDLFAKLKWHLAGAAFLLYAVLWGGFGSVGFWDSVYSAIFPPWSRWLLPVGYGLVFGALAIVFWRVSTIAARSEAVSFVLLGGLVSLVGHGIGISRGLLRVPLLAEASAASALVFGVFEFIFYWSVIIGIGVASRRLANRLERDR